MPFWFLWRPFIYTVLLDTVVHGAAQCIFLTNARWNHACLSTRLLSKQISRLQDSLGFIELRAEVQRDMTAKFATAVCATKDLVCDQALKEEIGKSEENGGAITILIDARHGCRRNAMDTNVVCIRNETYKVLREEHVTRETMQLHRDMNFWAPDGCMTTLIFTYLQSAAQ